MKNRLHKIISLLLAVCMLATAGLAFADGAPVLDGVHDQSVMAGTEFDALEGITAQDAEGNDLPKTVISREFSSEWKPGDEPYYPVNDEKNGALYAAYRQMAAKEEKVIFGGRLGEYKYYDMDAVIAAALARAGAELG